MKRFMKNYFILYGITGILSLVLLFFNLSPYIVCAADLIVLTAMIWRGMIDEKQSEYMLYFSGAILAAVLFTMLVITGGEIHYPLIVCCAALIPMYLACMISFLTIYDSFFIACVLMVAMNGLVPYVYFHRKEVKKTAIALTAAAVILASGWFSYSSRPSWKYRGHGFDYMHGYSSTDFTGYHVYSDPSLLAALDHPAALCIENEEDMPVMDGAEACYPLYAAVAKAIYKDIDKIEVPEPSDPEILYHNGKIVTFTNTVRGYYRLIYHDVDLMFGARPSELQKKAAEEEGEEYVLTQIGKEGFVFFTEEDNPVNDLTAEQVRKIYSGEITNWKEVGGKDQKITAFQRPEGSGSQTMMQYFMGDTQLMEAPSYQVISAMEGVIREVSQYANEAGAIGYTFRYFLEGLHQEKNVKILSIDGVMPTVETIEDGSYPLTTGLYCVTLASNQDPNVQAVLDFLLSEDGQYLVRASGYGGLGN